MTIPAAQGQRCRPAGRLASLPVAPAFRSGRIHERQAVAFYRCSLARATSSLRVLFHEPGQLAQAGTSWAAILRGGHTCNLCPCHNP
eukprot:SM000110S18942  [mRNA]  locus=s110:443563:443840:- [translate_table: standard]